MLRFSKKVEDATNISSSYPGNYFHSSFYPVQSLRDSRFTASGGKDWGDARRLLGGQLAQPDDARQPVLLELVIRYHRAVGQRRVPVHRARIPQSIEIQRHRWQVLLVGLWPVDFGHDGTGGTNFFNTRQSSDRRQSLRDKL